MQQMEAKGQGNKDDSGNTDKAAEPSLPPAPTVDNPMVGLIIELVDDVALAIEQKLGSIAALRAQGGPYVESLVIQQNRKIHEAASAAIATILNHPKLRPMQD